MNGKSEDILKGKIKELKKIFPEAITEGKVDFEQLKATLGSEMNTDNERYVLNWAGKSEAFRVLQQPTTATLAPAPKESVNFDTTENIFIEGENLEVLKVLQKSYYGKIKMIYIDPPYNTGNDSFIYPDKFAESKEEYLKRIGEKDEEGYLLKEGLFRKNSKENGQFHSVWLSMMYPRLFLARNLLRDDGLIFISIDENEVHNLRIAMNEIFGEENFVTNFAIKLRHEERILKGDKDFHEVIEYLLCYAKSNERKQRKKVVDNTSVADYRFQIVEKTKKPEKIVMGEKEVLVFKPDEYEIVETGPSEENLKKISIRGSIKEGNSSGRFYMKHLNAIKEHKGHLYKVPDMGNDKFKDRYFLKPVSDKMINGDYFQGVPLDREDFKEVPFPNFFDFVNEFNNVGYEGDIEFRNGKKPIKFLQKLMEIGDLNSNDIILDFFAGSASIAHAVLDLNAKEGTSRKYICIQLPENIEKNTSSYIAGFNTIADIAKERIRRVVKSIKIDIKQNKDLFTKDTPGLDLGFKVFKLKDSNFKIWRSDVIENKDDLGRQLDIFQSPVKLNAEMNNMMYELIIKNGYDLTTKIEEREFDKCPIYMIADAEMVICLSKLTDKAVKEILNIKPKKVICLDSLFEHNDKLKTNTSLQLKDKGIELKTI